ncbi:FAD/NAD(P)-binding domain-containing protein [Aspergillus sclerotiicarbonarius CBS 121057]|uniref:FAD/NAD(P)-binding domain-containing protein n=1 Tax=Aspergillus sclerotiicarbonarius (strain CBS 121057 / IBT 28362) TaxID=1448318 RepID=A0A319DY86_ASPSB|nr:FAD/NAD(P)-binding domain-containing protein [Aspergillus sclerotiicarbonarius CBS 121057]
MAEDTVKDMHVAIIGLALAMGLHKKGVPFTVYEAASEYSTVGAGIGFGPNGDLALNMIQEGFLPQYERVCVGHKPPAPQHIYYEGLLLEEGLGLRGPWHGNSSWGHPDYIRRAAHRNAVLQIMTSFIPIEKVRFSKRLTDIEQLPNKVILTFADGQVAEACVVVGADGIKSIVREHVLGPTYPDQVDPVYSNSYCYRGVIPIAEGEEILGDLTDVAKMYLGDRRCCVTYLISGGAELNFLLCVADDKPWEFKNTVTQNVSYETMMADFEGRGVDERFVQLLQKAQPIKWGLFHHRNTSTYYRGRVVLIGDSAHASLPFQAAGAGQGLEDALVLSHILTRIFNAPGRDESLEGYINAGFAGYDSVRRPRAQRQLERAHEMSLMLYFQHPETGSSMEKIIEKLQNGWFDWLWFRDLNADIQAAVRGVDEVRKT